MRFDWKNGLIWIEIEILYAGQSIKIDNCIVDTGSVSTAIDIDFVRLTRIMCLLHFLPSGF
jgi:hypothetical protein